ncbi:MAG: hypothetical protein ACD_2C00064G0003 [uncultured bacterium (gcode 4)]|uniref:Uncharacterized protein n=1 Tax=uncultured bacterium (gcode 4) TaxID=1234023 RepID=K2FFN8_9BACT|nr:MAG: hypothetical protein ACD_2C00064G0003 [uncultured bacterium (gcode 4)]
MHKPAYHIWNRIPEEQKEALLEIKRLNSEKIFDILWKVNLSLEDLDALLAMLSEETPHLNSIAEFSENSTFIFLSSYIKISEKDTKENFIKHITSKAREYPLMVFCFLNELKVFQDGWIWKHNEIKEMLSELESRNIEFRRYLNI